MNTLDRMLVEYDKKFKSSVPTGLLLSYPHTKLIPIIKKCILQNKTVKQMGYPVGDDDIFY